MPPEIRYAKSGDISIAYQVYGEGPMDLVIVFGFISHLDMFWESPAFVDFMNHLGSFARVIIFDKRGVGLSDPVIEAATLEERMDDVRAVMDAAGSQRAALFGLSEGAAMCILFATTYPERTHALTLYGGMARSVYADDYPYASDRDSLLEANEELVGPFWGQGASVDIFAPSVADDPNAKEFYARFERQAASPQMIQQLGRMFLDIDVRDVLQTIQVPTLIIHRRGDRVVNVRAARYLADHISGAKLVELDGIDHSWLAGDSNAIVGEIEEFLTGVRAAPSIDRVLATVLFTDIVDSTKKAAELGDRAWRDVLERHQGMFRTQLNRDRGREVKTTGDGFLATFDGPARAIRCAKGAAEGVRSLGIELRAGIHTGECERMGDDIGGIAVHTAARISALAGPGEVLVSRTVRDLVAGSGITFEDRGSHLLKGIPDEWQLLLVTGA